MATINLKFNCGCGFNGHSATEAEAHAEEKGHKIEVLGTIIPRNRKVKPSKSAFRAPSPDYVPPNSMRQVRGG